MPAKLRLAVCQINPCVGDFSGNAAKIREGLLRARRARADVALFPEMAVAGYPPEDLVFKKSFLDENARAMRRLAEHCRGLWAIVGGVERGEDGKSYNTAFVLRNGRIEARYRKMCLPNYGVFDEARHFAPGAAPLVLACGKTRVAVSICEDLWLPQGAYRRALRPGSADCLVNLSASPYERTKFPRRRAVAASFARRYKIPVFLANLVGGQDELVFDGQSFATNASGRLIALAKAFEEDFFVVDWPAKRTKAVAVPKPGSAAEVYRALVLGTRDYVDNNGFPKVLVGLSGGIDSSLAACLAVDALGRGRVVGVTMPSAVTSAATLSDARRLADNLGIALLELPIRALVDAYADALRRPFEGVAPGTAEENIQARIRGNLLMALSNKFGWLVLTTGNKSEIATGYCTLYGDMAGGFAVIKDVPKTLVYRLVEYRNRAKGGAPVPFSVIRRVPSAELRPGQTDQDVLPPYPELDRFIERYVDRDWPAKKAAAGLRHLDARRVARMIDRNEYKRRQAPPGIKVTSKAFGRDRRMPITSRFSGLGS